MVGAVAAAGGHVDICDPCWHCSMPMVHDATRVGVLLLSVVRMCVLKETMLMSVVSAATRGYVD